MKSLFSPYSLSKSVICWQTLPAVTETPTFSCCGFFNSTWVCWYFSFILKYQWSVSTKWIKQNSIIGQLCCNLTWWAWGSHFASHPDTVILQHCGTQPMGSSSPPLECADPLSTVSLPQATDTCPPALQPTTVIYLCPDASTIPGISLIGINVNREVWSGQKVNSQLKLCSEGLFLLYPKFTLKGSVT